MNIYLNLSGRSDKKQINLVTKVQSYLQDIGHKIVLDYLSKENFEDFYKPTSFHIKHVYDQADSLMKKSDVVILETSTPSITIGFQILHALKHEKNVICLYTKGNRQLFIEGIDDERFQLWEYSEKNYKKVIDLALDNLFFENDVRYNMMLSKKMNLYLNKLSKKTKTPKAVYIRGLIKEDMKGKDL
ncbi:MAG: hypothetical protein OEX81_00205 [Candidatus Pacebacteria bacterium]|nr:hypothetical protein [Candidatus Paceibacterota bacterium]